MYDPTAHLLMGNLLWTHHWPQQSNPNDFEKHTFVLPLAGEEVVVTFQDFGLGCGQRSFLTSIDLLLVMCSVNKFRFLRYCTLCPRHGGPRAFITDK